MKAQPRLIALAAIALTLTVLPGCPSQQGSPAPDLRNEPPTHSARVAQEKPPTAAAGAGNRYALLVGCTKYDRLSPVFWLEGPANDVVLLRRVLVDRFRFPDGNIVTLSEAMGVDHRPTRANVEREFRRLAEKVRPGDQVVISLSGHGSQEPDHEPLHEEDGLQQIFLPADAGPWDGGLDQVANAIIADDLRAWARGITQTGASLWIIVDACHSGMILRGTGETPRRVPPGILVPTEALRKAQERARRRFGQKRGPVEKAPLIRADASAGHLAAIYAAQPDEVTVEKELPADSPDAKPYGLLTYTLCGILSRPTATPLTYREVVQKIVEQYQGSGRNFPTPLVEGKDRDREVLGTAAPRSGAKERAAFLLGRSSKGGSQIDGGALHGLTVGSILAVWPAAGAKRTDRPLGHVRITSLRPLEADVEPCAFEAAPEVRELPVGGRCVPVFHHFGDLRLRVTVEAVTDGKRVEAAQERVRSELQRFADRGGCPISLVKDAGRADWLVRVAEDNVYVLPAHGVKLHGPPDQKSTVSLIPKEEMRAATPVFGPFPASRPAEMLERLQRIARAEMLKRMATSLAGAAETADSGVAIGIDLLRLRDPNDTEGQVIAWPPAGLQMHPGELFAVRIENRSPSAAVYVTLLFLDSDYGITALYPRGGRLVKRLPPEKSFLVAPLRVTGKTVGTEHLVAIAVEATGPPMDLTCLEQPTIERARGSSRGKDWLDSPMGKLFQAALYAQGTSRGVEEVVLQEYALRLVSWRTVLIAPEVTPTSQRR